MKKAPGMLTEKILVSMLKEDTGRSMCDSGGAYGRNHERNATRTIEDFRRESAAWYEVYTPLKGKTGASLNVIFSLFHWLMARLRYEPKLQAKLAAFGRRKSMEHESWFSIVEDWLKHIKATGPDGWSKEPTIVNTYNNGGSCLSQVIQYTGFSVPGDPTPYIVLFIHGGCDVRGGYSMPRIFRIESSNCSFSDMYDDDRYRIEGYSDGIRTGWESDGGAEHEIMDADEAPAKMVAMLAANPRKDLAEYPFKMMKEGEKRKLGVIYVNEEKTIATCPITGSNLSAWPYGDF